jgi:regulator of cell morphogenesis and NO signaling
MSWTTEKTVRELALKSPAATRVFEKLGIDYCCGGNKSLEEACHTANLNMDQVLDSLEMAEQSAHAAQKDRDWQVEPLADLIGHIKNKHHKYTREEIARLGPLFDKVCSVHRKNHPELPQIHETFRGLAQELTTHMMKEEMVLFPYIVRMEESVIQREPVLPPPFGSVQNPVTMMMHEHDSAGDALRAMRQASAGYTPPGDACISYQTLYKALADFEADLHQHIHLENNILFPRAIAMEPGHGEERRENGCTCNTH